MWPGLFQPNVGDASSTKTSATASERKRMAAIVPDTFPDLDSATASPLNSAANGGYRKAAHELFTRTGRCDARRSRRAPRREGRRTVLSRATSSRRLGLHL